MIDGVFGQLSGKKETHCSLDFPRGDGGPLVVVGKTGSLRSNTLENVVDKGVHDGHGFGGDSSVGVNLLQHLVDVDSVGFLPLVLPLLSISLGNVLLGFSCLLGSLSTGLWWHVENGLVTW
ncbi:hypothetical protein Ocin01_19146 [Orchesella cincta]|uniref:Uncharacterized protein n=1 Tax=Orchesella cincta TaxID=48709 RepID=A0A1D2M3I6_ORCCI|nr:hypothetical protein Ocin01_19146 [Orchesella cincta]